MLFNILQPILSEETRGRGSTQQTTNKINLDSSLNCPHDLTKVEEFRDDLPTLLGNILRQKSRILLKTVSQKNALDIEKDKSVSCVFSNGDNIAKKSNVFLQRKKMKELTFLGPYERYKLIKKYLQYEEETQEKEEKNNKVGDAQRIATLQEHFEQLASNTEQQISENVEKRHRNEDIVTGVKRKRSSSPKYVADNNFIPACQEINETVQESSPKRTKNQNEEYPLSPGKKDPQQSETFTPSKNKNKKKNQKNKNVALNDMKQGNNQAKKGWNPQNPSRRGKRPPNHPEQQSSREGKRLRHTRFESSENPFDYNSVDFRQFQGGGSSANQPTNVDSQFKSRVSNFAFK